MSPSGRAPATMDTQVRGDQRGLPVLKPRRPGGSLFPRFHMEELALPVPSSGEHIRAIPGVSPKGKSGAGSNAGIARGG